MQMAQKHRAGYGKNGLLGAKNGVFGPVESADGGVFWGNIGLKRHKAIWEPDVEMLIL